MQLAPVEPPREDLRREGGLAPEDGEGNAGERVVDNRAAEQRGVRARVAIDVDADHEVGRPQEAARCAIRSEVA